MNSPQIFVLKRADGKFYNHTDRHFYSKLSLGSYAKSKSEFAPLLVLEIFKDCEVFGTTEEEWTKDMAHVTTAAILKLESAKRNLEEINYNLPTVSKLHKSIGNSMQNTLVNLQKISPMYQEFISKKENETDDVMAVYDEFIAQMAKVEMWQCSEVSAMIAAYFKDRSSMLGITKKVINN